MANWKFPKAGRDPQKREKEITFIRQKSQINCSLDKLSKSKRRISKLPENEQNKYLDAASVSNCWIRCIGSIGFNRFVRCNPAGGERKTCYALE